jgi:aminopeptidase N
MESPALNWISSTVSGARLRHIVVHEAAHQWYYSAVGNNQATNPFVDEAVSDFLTRDHLGTFRKSNCATARLDRHVYDYSAKCYPEVVYVQGAQYLRAYRAEVGVDRFWAGLSRFYREKATRIAGTRALLDTLDAESGFDSRRHADRFPSLYQ